jgi:hypothetical protein
MNLVQRTHEAMKWSTWLDDGQALACNNVAAARRLIKIRTMVSLDFCARCSVICDQLDISRSTSTAERQSGLTWSSGWIESGQVVFGSRQDVYGRACWHQTRGGVMDQ